MAYSLSLNELLNEVPTMKELCENARISQWRMLGTMLEVDETDLDNIKRKENPDEHLCAMYNVWLQKKGKAATRHVLLEALKSKPVGKFAIAEEYLKKLQTGEIPSDRRQHCEQVITQDSEQVTDEDDYSQTSSYEIEEVEVNKPKKKRKFWKHKNQGKKKDKSTNKQVTNKETDDDLILKFFLSVINHGGINQLQKDGIIRVLHQFQKVFKVKCENIISAELAYLSQKTRSCQISVKNQTKYTIRSVSNAILGICRVPAGVESFDIKPNNDQDYLYEKADFSPKGCAGVQTFTVDLPKNLKVSFLVAFRNYTVQIRKPSKVVILRMNKVWDCEERNKIDVRSFDEIMRNEEESPTFKFLAAYQGKSNERTFNSLVAGAQNGIRLYFDNIIVAISMTPDSKSTVEVHLSTKPADEKDT